MLVSQDLSQIYFLKVISLSPSVTPCLQLYNLYICLQYRNFCSLASKCNTRCFLLSFYLKRTSVSGHLRVFKPKRRLKIISCCRLACKNISRTLRSAFRTLTTSAAPYLTSINIYIDHTYILCFILIWKYLIGTFLFIF